MAYRPRDLYESDSNPACMIDCRLKLLIPGANPGGSTRRPPPLKLKKKSFLA